MLAQLAILNARTADAARGGELAELAIAEAGDQPAALGQALAAAAIIDLTGGNLSRGRHRVPAARLLDQAGDRRGSARLLYWRAMACFIDGRLPNAVTQLDRLAHPPVTPGEVLRLWSPRATRGHALAILGQAGEGLDEIDETLAWARAARHPAVEAECLWHRAEALAILGQADQAIESAKEAARIAARIGHAEWTAAADRGLGIACEVAGLPGRAEASYRRSLEAAEGIPLFRAWAAARLGAFLAREGRPGQAAPHVQAALAGGTRSPATRPGGHTPSSSPARATTRRAAQPPRPPRTRPRTAATWSWSHGYVNSPAADPGHAPSASKPQEESAIAGIGNIYADEVLHRARIHPSRPAAASARPEAPVCTPRSQDILT